MCQAIVFLMHGEEKREIMRDVIALEADGDEVRIRSFFDAPQTLRARVRQIDFLKHTVTLEPSEEVGEDDEREG
ncbi:MAG: CooT family nickel-binding protein [Anaerolineae bacterium]|nr:CooT family nickel-binding protein [Anaerolineae bacterium]